MASSKEGRKARKQYDVKQVNGICFSWCTWPARVLNRCQLDVLFLLRKFLSSRWCIFILKCTRFSETVPQWQDPFWEKAEPKLWFKRLNISQSDLYRESPLIWKFEDLAHPQLSRTRDCRPLSTIASKKGIILRKSDEINFTIRSHPFYICCSVEPVRCPTIPK